MVSYIRPGRIYLAMGSYCLYRASRPLRKGRSGVLTSTDFETMASHDVGAVYFTEYLSVLFQLTYLDKLYGECNGTARACVNSGYQALFSPITAVCIKLAILEVVIRLSAHAHISPQIPKYGR